MSGQIPLNLRPTPQHSYDTFLETPSNAAALSILRGWPNWPSPALLLLGPAGAGKTHLGQAWAADTGGTFIDDAPAIAEDTLFDLINRALSGTIPGLLLAAETLWDVDMPDLRSRLGAMPTAQLLDHDDASLEPILRGLFDQAGREVSRDVVTFLLKYTDRSVNALRALVGELDLAAGAAKADLTKSFVSKYLKNR